MPMKDDVERPPASAVPDDRPRPSDEAQDASVLLQRIEAGDKAAVDLLFPLVYDQLKRMADNLMRRERPGHTLGPNGLVHEAYARLVDQKRIRWLGRNHFFAVGAMMLRRILVDYAKAHHSLKKGGRAQRIDLDDVREAAATPDRIDVLAVDEALTALAALEPRQARVVELRFFAGLGIDEIAQVLDVSPRTVKSDWRAARQWLHSRIGSKTD
jgi:RNA polymerase sigma factor (TIGR02999 family)